jgi:hypothetical protein
MMRRLTGQAQANPGYRPMLLDASWVLRRAAMLPFSV